MIKPTILLLLILGISGYLYLHGVAKYHYRLYRTNGYHTFFRATAYGLLFFFLAIPLNDTFQWLGKLIGIQWDLGTWVLKSFSLESKHSDATLINISFIAIAIGFSYPKFYYICSTFKIGQKVNILSVKRLVSLLDHFISRVKRNRESDLLNEFLGDVESPEFTRLIKKSRDLSLPILFTMSDHKVFIGYLYEFTGGTLINDLLILPLQSGYRCEKTKKLNIVTRYVDVVRQIKKDELEEFKKLLMKEDPELTLEECERIVSYGLLDSQKIDPEELEPYLVAIPYREIVHAHLHDIDLLLTFQQHEDGQPCNDSSPRQPD
ncbi:hypothetical protein P3710_20440 [Vibrio parahaemolyticus]|nr:hypothetical protein [Vibrio parahaemolyticus]